MASQKNLLIALLGAIAAYIIVGQSLTSIVLILAVAGTVHMYTKDVIFSLGAAILVALLQSMSNAGRPYSAMGIDRAALTAEASTRGFEAAAAEGFQGSDTPASIHERVVAAKQPAAKVQNITGVLESPSILDNVPLKPMQELTYDAQPGASIPASAKARVIINPPAEGFVPAPKESEQRALKRNPYLQNGEDEEGVEAAMISKGTDMTEPEVPSNELPAAMAGEAPAF
jgi:hypothetical protein